jgi:mono/diheme cytochrome c family protein
MNMREPVKGTVARGQQDFANYSFTVSNESYEASASLKNPVASSAKVIAEGQTLYNINCTPCHGDKGLGDGTIVSAGKFPPPPSYDSDRIKTTPDGKMFYSIRYGKNLMGAYGTVLTPNQIWKVVHYIRTVSGPYKSASNVTASK